jgi:hypothetical protein
MAPGGRFANDGTRITQILRIFTDFAVFRMERGISGMTEYRGKGLRFE